MGTVLRRRIVLIAMVVGSFVIGAAVAWMILHTPFIFGGNGGGVADRPLQFFVIDGDLDEPLYPGVTAPLELSITNPLETDLAVSKLSVEIDAVDAPNATESMPCDVDDFAVVQQVSMPDEVIIPAGATTTLTDLGIVRSDWPLIQMLDSSSNQDGCKHAVFSLVYSAEGRIVE